MRVAADAYSEYAGRMQPSASGWSSEPAVVERFFRFRANLRVINVSDNDR